MNLHEKIHKYISEKNLEKLKDILNEKKDCYNVYPFLLKIIEKLSNLYETAPPSEGLSNYSLLKCQIDVSNFNGHDEAPSEKNNDKYINYQCKLTLKEGKN